jgi:hypothetical protein
LSRWGGRRYYGRRRRRRLLLLRVVVVVVVVVVDVVGWRGCSIWVLDPEDPIYSLALIS